MLCHAMSCMARHMRICACYIYMHVSDGHVLTTTQTELWRVQLWDVMCQHRRANIISRSKPSVEVGLSTELVQASQYSPVQPQRSSTNPKPWQSLPRQIALSLADLAIITAVLASWNFHNPFVECSQIAIHKRYLQRSFNNPKLWQSLPSSIALNRRPIVIITAVLASWNFHNQPHLQSVIRSLYTNATCTATAKIENVPWYLGHSIIFTTGVTS